MERKLVISKFNLRCSILLWVLSFPSGISALLPKISYLLLTISIAMTLFNIVEFYFYKNNKIPQVIWLVGALGMLLVLSTIVNGGDILRAIKIAYTMIAAFIWADIYMRMDYRRTIGILSKWSWFLIVANCIISVLFPNGIYQAQDLERNQYSFLGVINNMEVYWISGIAFCVLDAYFKKQKEIKSIIILVVLVTIPNIVFGCKTGIVLTIFLCLLLLFTVYMRSVVNTKVWVTFFVVCMVGCAVILLGDIFSSQSLLENYRTLISRVGLWETSIEMIRESWIIGQGVGANDAIVYYNQWKNLTPHNMYLMFALWGGVGALLIFILICKKTTRYKLSINDKAYSVLLICFTAQIIYFMVEVTVSFPLFCVLLMATYYYGRFYAKEVAE